MQTNTVCALAKALADAPKNAPEVIAELLRKLRDGTRTPDYGICGYIENTLFEEFADGDDAFEVLEQYEQFWEDTKRVLFPEWGEYSGDIVFPVSTFSEGYSPHEQYVNACDDYTIWDGEYGEARLRLLDYLIEEYTGLCSPRHAAHFKHNQPEESQ